MKPGRKEILGLRHFLLSSKASRLYREYVKEIYRLPNTDLREEYINELRNEFQKTKELSKNEKQWEFLLADGRQKLPMIKEMISRIL